LFYTGITRLAKNILQDVVDRFNENRPDYLFTVDWVRQLALNARSAIARRDMHELARTINSSWEANNRIHASTTNEQVEALRAGTSGLWRGMKLLGAGGGGYALFVSEDPDQGEALRLRLRESFENERARIVDFSLNPLGLQVTVS
jgi:galactokinase/mevalonate kinase-like predicted kinase